MFSSAKFCEDPRVIFVALSSMTDGATNLQTIIIASIVASDYSYGLLFTIIHQRWFAN
jgi:hypothetical protein